MLHLHVPWNVVGLNEKQFSSTRTTRIYIYFWGGGGGGVSLCLGGGEIIVVIFETSHGLLNVK